MLETFGGDIIMTIDECTSFTPPFFSITPTRICRLLLSWEEQIGEKEIGG